ncbi:carbon-nitrogen hydrolase family protein [Gulosibacter sp. GYB002]|uniref:carbon-nitrogen hydrolase family protein n=1 Tax=Gulosibacter sp. GYB002 TaxID=2994391 RepID=UPI002F965378
MLSPIAVAVAQFNPSLDREANLETMSSYAALAAERGARVVVFPEYSQAFTAQLGAWMREVAEPDDGGFVTTLTEIANDLEIVIVAGMLERTTEAEKPYNTVVAVGEGRMLAKSRKLHLYDAFGTTESDWLQAGDPHDAPATFEIGGMRFGLQTCYDLRFPEVSRRLADAGAQVLVIPAEWVRGPLKEHHWQTLLRARAIENTVAVVAADHAPPVAVGHSCIIDARGVVTAKVGVEQGVAVGWIEPDEIDEVRQTNPALRLRKYAVTALDTAK